ncbi:hypothetical protein SLOPH_919 [Spraguea lophii 42_110]|uniref:Uncharacterized protein n=1 Tax=Spraguea lophii (strain 42_110) TaxID=1358809 RepID=S7XSY9_SPRLO|nr:hypothetical protein SLOPH_919 [Spraguea lophii 42_110]
MLTKDQCRKIWYHGNIAFIGLYSIFITTIFIRLPYIKNIPLFICNFPLVLSYLATLVDYYPSNISGITKDGNFYAALLIYSLSTSYRIFMLPFYLFSIVNLSSYICSNRKEYENSNYFIISSIILDNKKQMLLLAYTLEIILPVLLILKGLCFLGLEWMAFSLVIALLKYEMKNSYMKKAVRNIFYTLEKLLYYVPSLKNRFFMLKSLVQEKIKYKLD